MAERYARGRWSPYGRGAVVSTTGSGERQRGATYCVRQASGHQSGGSARSTARASESGPQIPAVVALTEDLPGFRVDAPAAEHPLSAAFHTGIPRRERVADVAVADAPELHATAGDTV